MRPATHAPPVVQPSRLWKGCLIASMAFGGLSMWLLNPILWLWLTSKLQSGTQPSMGPYALLLLGIVLTCCAIGKAISVLHRHYERITGATPTVRVILPWRRSLRGGRSQGRETDGRLPVSVLDVIMVMSVVLAVASFTAWFTIVQPTPPNIGGSGPAKH
jgi:threonine/homoserine/homoserine lactone efflux protein